MPKRNYIPALRFHWLTPQFYDTILYFTFPEKKIKQGLIDQLQLKGDETILDFGSGTGSLAIMIKEQFPSANIIGVDVDEKIIAFAEKKIKAKGLNIPLKQYDGENLSFFGNQQFDKVVSSLVFHHISTSGKRKILSQLYRIIKPGGELCIGDFGKPKNIYTKLGFGILRRFDGKENTNVNGQGLLPTYIEDAGFKDIQITKSYNTAFGSVDLITARNT